MEPENTPLKEENHLPNHHFQVRAVNHRGVYICLLDLASALPSFFCFEKKQRRKKTPTPPAKKNPSSARLEVGGAQPSST